MKRFAFLFLLLLAIPATAHAQVQWTQSNVQSAAQAQGFTYRVYVTPAGSSIATPITIAGVACTGSGTAPIAASCTAPISSALIAAGATITGAKSELTAQDGTSGESAKSAPFSLPASVPTGLVVKP